MPTREVLASWNEEEFEIVNILDDSQSWQLQIITKDGKVVGKPIMPLVIMKNSVPREFEPVLSNKIIKRTLSFGRMMVKAHTINRTLVLADVHVHVSI